MLATIILTFSDTTYMTVILTVNDHRHTGPAGRDARFIGNGTNHETCILPVEKGKYQPA